MRCEREVTLVEDNNHIDDDEAEDRVDCKWLVQGSRTAESDPEGMKKNKIGER